MRELVEKNQKITMVPFDFKNANKGVITEVNPDSFMIELDYDPLYFSTLLDQCVIANTLGVDFYDTEFTGYTTAE